MEICIAVADWARGLTTWVLDVPGGEGTDATWRKRQRQKRHGRHRPREWAPAREQAPARAWFLDRARFPGWARDRTVCPRASTGGSSDSGRRVGMVVGWG
ncbi:hypothetical protein GCM10023084_68960 [Streptomyces lacrimifluminis]|uniref:Uncharacterized protein n=1 Tax=Streptomyces lacrimifluminis TaxID=1500077 RepID=A0A917UIF1_9ACTN|nr:hypothetical protein GCM10012282_67420 [Streptomyces lacrimifluminis]